MSDTSKMFTRESRRAVCVHVAGHSVVHALGGSDLWPRGRGRRERIVVLCGREFDAWDEDGWEGPDADMAKADGLARLLPYRGELEHTCATKTEVLRAPKFGHA